MTYSYTQNTLLGNPNSTLIQLEHLDLGWVRFHPSGNTPIFPNYLALLNPEYNIVGGSGTLAPKTEAMQILLKSFISTFLNI